MRDSYNEAILDSNVNEEIKYLLPFQLLNNDGGKVRKRYGSVKGFGYLPGRYTFIIDKEGIVRHIFTSETNMKKHIDEAIRILKQIID